MKNLSIPKIIEILDKTLSYLDSRLMSHGKRVGYLVYSALTASGEYSINEIRDYCVLALLHDIGAYETEVIDQLVEFETGDVWEHSVYGYLFMKYYSPLSELAPIILFHHANIKELEHLEPRFRQMAQIIFVADRMDILAQDKSISPEEYASYFHENSGSLYLKEVVDLFFKNKLHIAAYNMEGMGAFDSIAQRAEFTMEEINGYAITVVNSIEFRTPPTVAHTITTIYIAQFLGERLGVEGRELLHLRVGALLHDIGKTGIPYEIVEKAGKLTEEEMETMQKHVKYTENILDGCIDENIMNIAIRHHEKINGTGYPYGLTGDQLTICEKILGVADIISALLGKRSYKEAFEKEQIVKILKSLDQNGQSDSKVVQTAIDSIDDIICGVKEAVEPVRKADRNIRKEYFELLGKIREF